MSIISRIRAARFTARNSVGGVLDPELAADQRLQNAPRVRAAREQLLAAAEELRRFDRYGDERSVVWATARLDAAVRDYAEAMDRVDDL